MATLTEQQVKSVEEVFINLVTADTDWSHAADRFVGWCLEEDFTNKSFQNFVEWVFVDAQGEPMQGIWTDEEEEEDAELNPKVWGFFYGYGQDYERFADDWVDQSERASYLEFCK